MKGVEGFNRSSPVSGPTFVDATEGGQTPAARGAALDRGGLDLQGRDLPLPAIGAPDQMKDMAGGAAFPPGVGASAALG